jgi:hypothetical protein
LVRPTSVARRTISPLMLGSQTQIHLATEMLILNQLSPDLGSRRLKLNLKWRPRDGNQGAYDLTYGRFSGFVQALLGYIWWSEVEKDVITSLLDSSLAFEQEAFSLSCTGQERAITARLLTIQET